MSRILTSQQLVVDQEDGGVCLVEERRTYDDGSEWVHTERMRRADLPPDAREGTVLGVRLAIEVPRVPIRRTLPTEAWEIVPPEKDFKL